MLEQSPGNFGNARVPYDWYQNVTHVIITVRIANLKENDVKVTIINDALDVMCQLMDGRQFRMHFNLYKTVMVAESNWAVDTSKLVINLRKNDRKRWHSLETIPDRTGVKPKSFIGIVNIREAKNELSNLLSATEFADGKDSAGGSGKDADGPGSTAITITRTRNNSGNSRAAGGNGDGQVEDDSLIESSQDPISLDYNWYQTDHYINLVIHVPNIKVTEGRSFLFYEDDINIILTDNTLNWICNFPTGVTNVNFKLYREINSNDSRYEISPCRTKIEIKLRKLDESYWPSFVMEGDEEVEEVVETTAGVEGEGEEVVSVEENGGESELVKQNNGGQTEAAAAVVVVATKSGAVKPAEPAAGKLAATGNEVDLVEDGENDQAPPPPSVATTNSAKIKPTPSAPSTRLQAAAH